MMTCLRCLGPPALSRRDSSFERRVGLMDSSRQWSPAGQAAEGGLSFSSFSSQEGKCVLRKQGGEHTARGHVSLQTRSQAGICFSY